MSEASASSSDDDLDTGAAQTIDMRFVQRWQEVIRCSDRGFSSSSSKVLDVCADKTFTYRRSSSADGRHSSDETLNGAWRSEKDTIYLTPHQSGSEIFSFSLSELRTWEDLPAWMRGWER